MPSDGDKSKTPGGKAVKPLRKQVEKSGREDQWANAPRQYRPLTAVDLYKSFLKVLPSAKGEVSSGYGAAGLSLGAEVTFDLGNFLLPGLLSAPLTGGIDGTKTQAAVLVVHHSMPDALAGPPMYGTNRPVTFVSMLGQGMSVSGSLSAGVYFVRQAPELLGEPPVAPTITELPLLFSGGATISGAYTYEKLVAVDVAPGWYPNAMDNDLQDDFLGIILPTSKGAIKREIVAWLDRFHKRIYPLTSRALGTSSRGVLQDRFIAVQQQRYFQNPTASLDKMTALGNAIIKGLGNAFPNVQRLFINLNKLSDRVEASQTSTDELIDLIQTVRALVPDADTIESMYDQEFSDQAERTTFKEAMTGMLAQLNSLETRLRRAKRLEQAGGTLAPKKGNVALPYPYRPDSYLKASSHEGEGEASISATVPLVGAGAGVTGKLKKSAFRYQTFTPNFSSPRSPVLVFTQDTSITYRQVEVGASASVKVYRWDVGKPLISRAMTYRSACAYWYYAPSRDLTVEAQPGSGASYGVSVFSRDLLDTIQSVKGTAPAGFNADAVVGLLARHLRLDPSQLTEFFDSVDLKVLATAAGGLPAVLLEAGYAFPAGKRLQTRPDAAGKAYELNGLWNYASKTGLPLIDGEALTLDSIRLRVRMADYSASGFQFKLGFGVPSVSTGVTLKIASVKKAGQEGVMDLYCRHYPVSQPPDPNLRVPRVSLFHQ